MTNLYDESTLKTFQQKFLPKIINNHKMVKNTPRTTSSSVTDNVMRKTKQNKKKNEKKFHTIEHDLMIYDINLN